MPSHILSETHGQNVSGTAFLLGHHRFHTASKLKLQKITYRYNLRRIAMGNTITNGIQTEKRIPQLETVNLPAFSCFRSEKGEAKRAWQDSWVHAILLLVLPRFTPIDLLLPQMKEGTLGQHLDFLRNTSDEFSTSLCLHTHSSRCF